MAVKENNYKFISDIPYLRVDVLGVQFIGNEFETDNRDLAIKLVNYDGITLISQPKK